MPQAALTDPNLLRQRRQLLGYSQATLAEKVGVHHSFIGALEAGTLTTCSVEVADRISDALNPAAVTAELGRLKASVRGRLFVVRKGGDRRSLSEREKVSMDPATLDEMASAYEGGVSSRQLGLRYGIAAATVRARLARAGVNLRK